MNHITAQIPQLLQHFSIKKPEELVIFEALQQYIDVPFTQAHVKKGHAALTIKLLPSQKQNLLAHTEEIIESLRKQQIYITHIR
ncbi:MAG TPA: hypothetical protein VGE63_03270 [Candidatus Paceibacterota bacterium]